MVEKERQNLVHSVPPQIGARQPPNILTQVLGASVFLAGYPDHTLELHGLRM